jgi:hypothetical protein
VNKPSRPTLEEIHSRATACLEDLIEQVSLGAPAAGRWDVAREALEALPLTTGEAATARNRLGNARAYSEAGEPGAACYELRMLAHALNDR